MKISDLPEGTLLVHKNLKERSSVLIAKTFVKEDVVRIRWLSVTGIEEYTYGNGVNLLDEETWTAYLP